MFLLLPSLPLAACPILFLQAMRYPPALALLGHGMMGTLPNEADLISCYCPGCCWDCLHDF